VSGFIFAADYVLINNIRERDVDKLEAMMCKNIKTQTPDLSSKIDELIDALDGQIIESSWSSSGGYDETGFGKRISRESWSYRIKTSAARTYDIMVTWVIIDTSSPGKMGLFNLSLFDYDLYQCYGPGSISDEDLLNCYLVRIFAE